MRRRIVRPVMLFALATSTVLAAGGSQRYDGNKDVTATVAGQQVSGGRQTVERQQPTSEENKKLVEAMRKFLNRSTEGLTVVKHPDGSEVVDLDGRFQTAFVATVNSDGSVSGSCVTSADEVAAFLSKAEKTTVDAEKNKTRKAYK